MCVRGGGGGSWSCNSFGDLSIRETLHISHQKLVPGNKDTETVLCVCVCMCVRERDRERKR